MSTQARAGVMDPFSSVTRMVNWDDSAAIKPMLFSKLTINKAKINPFKNGVFQYLMSQDLITSIFDRNPCPKGRHEALSFQVNPARQGPIGD
jgi:hypothetical protein